MEIVKLYELPMLTSNLYQEPSITIHNMNIAIELMGGDVDNKNKRVKLIFKNVLCHMHTSERFTKKMLNAYDTVVEIKNSYWLKELKKLNERDFQFWFPRHFAVYLDGIGMYQFIAKNYEVIEYE